MSNTNTDTAAAWPPLPNTGPLLRPYRPLAKLEVWPPRGAQGRLRPGAQVVVTPEGHITGVDFVVWAPSATRVELCLFAPYPAPTTQGSGGMAASSWLART